MATTPRSDLTLDTLARDFASLRGLVAAVTARLDAAEHYRRSIDEFETRVLTLETRLASAEGRIADLNLPQQTKALRDLHNQAILDLQFTARAMQTIRDTVAEVSEAVAESRDAGGGGGLDLSALMSGNLSGLPPELAAMLSGLKPG